jgi:hypothetical protein
MPVAAAAISPTNDFLLAVKARRSGHADAVDQPLDQHTAIACEAGADRIALSPRGTAAALYHSDSGMLQVVRAACPELPRRSPA